jgi:hypothetical protein
MILLWLFAVMGCAQLAIVAETPLAVHAAELYQTAKAGKFFDEAEKLKPEILPTTDGESFLIAWKSTNATNAPKRWIVSLHGTHGFATDDLAIWIPHLKGRKVSLLCLQWWLGEEDKYYRPEQIYREVDHALQRLGVKPGAVMLHGFSRGSANSYAVAALDAGRGKKYFLLCVASSGGVGVDYPPTRAITTGAYGEHPLKGTRWVTAAGARDPQPERDGIAGMKHAAAWLKEQGAIVLDSIEDPNSGHGALMLHSENVKRVLDLFLSEKP